MTDQTLSLDACRALAALGYPQGTGREPSTMLRWVVPKDGYEPFLSISVGFDKYYACPDSIAALDWLSTIGYAWSCYDVGPARGYWLRPHHASKPGPGPYDSPSALILAVAEREAGR